MRVYAIRTGSYSDMSWGPVFSTVEKAIAYKDSHKDSYISDIEVYVLDDENDTGPVYPCYRLIFDKDGNIIHWTKSGYKEPYEPELHKPSVWFVPSAAKVHAWGIGIRNDYPLSHVVVEDVYARDKKHAIKIAADARFKFLATGE